MGGNLAMRDKELAVFLKSQISASGSTHPIPQNGIAGPGPHPPHYVGVTTPVTGTIYGPTD